MALDKVDLDEIRNVIREEIRPLAVDVSEHSKIIYGRPEDAAGNGSGVLGEIHKLKSTMNNITGLGGAIWSIALVAATVFLERIFK